MAYVFDETFEVGIPAGFATPGGYGDVAATWNADARAVDLVFQERQSFWRIHAAETTDDFWFEFEVQTLARTYDSVALGAWFWAGDRYSGHRLLAWKQLWHHCWWQANGTQHEQVELAPALWAVTGTRRTLRFDVKRMGHDVWLFQITDNGQIVRWDYKRSYESLLPCLYGYGLTMRVFRVAGGTPSALGPPPAPAFLALPAALGRTLPVPDLAGLRNYRQRAFHRLAGTRNHHYHGDHRIAGTVKEKGVPDDRPVARRVLLFDQRTHLCVRETWSDPVTGAYTFDHIDPVPRYIVIAYDHTHHFRAVIADNLRAEPMGRVP